MSFVALTNFITITNPKGSVQGIPEKFQNGKHGSVGGHAYLSFIYQGATKNRTGDNMTASLLLANSELCRNYANEIVSNGYHIKIETWLMTEDFEKSKSLADEEWLASSMSYDSESIELILSSGVDAVGANAPHKVLTKELVGHLPVTGSLQNR